MLKLNKLNKLSKKLSLIIFRRKKNKNRLSQRWMTNKWRMKMKMKNLIQEVEVSQKKMKWIHKEEAEVQNKE